jgi:spermidine synthase
MLSLLFGATVYAFSVILAVFLIGLGIGSAAGAVLVRKLPRPDIGFGICQFLLVLAIPYAGYAIHFVIPELHFVTSHENWLKDSLDDLLRCAVAVIPATSMWGASFPLALAAAGPQAQDPGKSVGRVYAANTIGAITGAMIVSLLMIPLLGTPGSQQALTLFSVLATIIILGAALLRMARTEKEAKLNSFRSLVQFAVLIAITVAAGVMTNRGIPGIQAGMIAYGHRVKDWKRPWEYLYMGEGLNASVAVSRERQDKFRQLHVGGKVVASNLVFDMRLQRMLGHLPSLIHPAPKSVFIIGFGAGVTAGTLTLYPGIERILIVEIEPEVAKASARYFKAENYDVLNDPRTEIIYDDARHFMTTTKERFDIISTDPIHPYVKGAASLYSKEFLELSAKRLNPGGIVSQWVPFYETNEAAVKSGIATFFEAFPNGSIWNSREDRRGYDVVMIGHATPIRIDDWKIQHRMNANAHVRNSLSAVNIRSALDMLKTYSGSPRDIRRWLSDAQLNLDRNLRLEYLAGKSLHTQRQDDIYFKMVRDLRYPSDLFITSKLHEVYLRQWFSQLRSVARHLLHVGKKRAVQADRTGAKANMRGR